MEQTSNPTTPGMDGADRAEWHTPPHEIDGYMVAAVTVLACVLLLVMATAALQSPPVTVAMWQIGLALSVAAFIGFACGVVTMALAAMAHSDVDGAE